MQNKDARILAVIVGIILVCVCICPVTLGGIVILSNEPLRTIFLSNPSTAEEYNHRGLTYYNFGQTTQAISDFTRAIELNPNYAEAYFNRGNVYESLGEYKTSIGDYTRAIQLNPTLAQAYSARGYSYTRVGEYEPSIADFKKAIELDPQNVMALNNLCWYGSALGHAADVLPACKQAVNLAPNNGGCRDSRGLARALTGDYQGAIEDFKAYVTWSKQNGRYAVRGVKREKWITELEAGRNPFDAATLQDLLAE